MKNRVYRTLALTLAALTAAAAVTACAAAPAAETPAAEAPAAEAPAAEAVQEEAAAPAEEAAPAAEEWEGDIDNIKVLLFDTRGVGQYAGPVIDKLNELTEKKAGVHADVTMITIGEYISQLGLQLASGDQLDVISLGFGPTSFASLLAQGQLMDITDLLENEGAGTYEELKDYINVFSLEGRIYGLPPYRNYSSSSYMTMRKDTLEELGMLDSALAMTSWDEVEALFDKVATETDLKPMASGKNILWSSGDIFPGGKFSDAIFYDGLGDSLGLVYTDEATNTVSNLLEQDAYRQQQEMVRKWYDTGWIYKDSPYEDNTSEVFIKDNVSFAMFGTSEYGVETAKKEATGRDVVSIELIKNKLTTGNVSSFGLAIPHTAQEPEAAMRWINELYTNPDAINLLFWGVEGDNYVIKDGQAAYPDGTTPNSIGYHSVDFLYGNYFAALPWEGSGANFRQEAYDMLKSAEMSPYFGFNINADGLTNLVSGLSAITDQYNGAIRCGAFTDEMYDEYLADLKAASVDEYLAAYQEQLDAWLANK